MKTVLIIINRWWNRCSTLDSFKSEVCQMKRQKMLVRAHTHARIRIKSEKWNGENLTDRPTDRISLKLHDWKMKCWWCIMLQLRWSHKIAASKQRRAKKQNENEWLQHRMPLTGTVIEFTMALPSKRYTDATVARAVAAAAVTATALAVIGWNHESLVVMKNAHCANVTTAFFTT